MLGKDNDGQLEKRRLHPAEEIESVTILVEKQIEQDQIRVPGIHSILRFTHRLSLTAAFELLLIGQPVDEVLAKKTMVLDHEHAALRRYTGNRGSGEQAQVRNCGG